MPEAGENLSRVVQTWAELIRSGRAEALADIMDEEVVWQGLRPELACHGRREAARVLQSGAGQWARITEMSAEEAGDRVLVSVRSDSFPEGPAGPELSPGGGARSLLLTFSEGRVCRMESFPSLEAARQALRAS